MGFGYTRTHLQSVSEKKIQDAQILFLNQSYSNAYYLAGYAVEIGLKACIARSMLANTIPPLDIVRNFATHKFDVLVGLAGLQGELNEQKQNNVDFSTNWAIVSRWGPDFRYETKDITSAQSIIDSIVDQNSGVLNWIRTHW